MSTENEQFYVTLFSNSSKQYYPDNTLAAFTVRLARPIVLDNSEKWEVGICEFSCVVPKKPGYHQAFTVVPGTHAIIYCDIITPQFVGGQYIRCLRTLTWYNDSDIQFKHIYYVPVAKRQFQNIRTEVMGTDGNYLALKDSTWPTKVVLHFRRVSTVRI